MSSDSYTAGNDEQHEDTPTDVLNNDALVGLAEDEEELTRRYKTALAPHNVNTEPADHVVIDEDYYSQTLVVRDWPDRPVYGFLDSLISFSMPSVETTVTTHFTGEDDRDAERELSNAAGSVKDMVRDYAASKWIPEYFVEKAAEMYGSIKRTQTTVRQSEYGLYTSQTYIEVRAPSTDHLDAAVSLIRSKMQGVNADAVPLKYDHDLGYQTAAPACKDYIGGETKMVGDGLSRLVPWTAQNLIEPGGIELGINEDTGDPIILDLWNRETGFNIGIWGTIGGGKTTTMTRTLTRSKMQNSKIPQVIIDPRQEFDGYAEAFGGKRLVIGSETGINPFMIEPIAEEKREELGEKAPLRKAKRRGMRFLESYYNFMGFSFEDKQGLWRDVVDVGFERRGITEDPATHHYDNPTLADDFIPILEEAADTPQKFLRESLEDSDFAKGRVEKVATKILQNDVNALEEGSEFEHLAKETTVDIADIDVLVLDLQNYENDAAAGLVMEPLLIAILEQAKSSDEPMQLGIDEFHYMFHNTTSIETLKRAYRYSRHSDLSVITSTQTVSEFYTENEAGVKQLTNSAKELISMMSVKIFHYSDEMDKELASEFDMSDAEYSYHKDASTGDPTAQALLQVEKEGSFKLDVNFDDELNPREFALNQYDPTDDGYDLYEYLADYTDADGRDPCEWTWEMPMDDDATGQPVDIAESGQVSEKGQLDDYSSPGSSSASAEMFETEAEAKADGEPETGAGAGTDSPDQTRDEPPVDESDPSNGEIESDESTADGSAGFASRVKSSVSSAVGRNNQDASEAAEDPKLTDIHGVITARMASDLRAAGYESVEDFFEADNTALAEIEGIDPTKAAFLRRHAGETIGRSTSIVQSPEATGNRANTDGTESDREATTSSAQESEEAQPSDTPGSDESADADDTAAESNADDPATLALTDIQEVGGDRADVLHEAGYESVGDVATATESALTDVDGIGGARAGTIVESATDLVDEQSETPAAAAGGDD